MRRSQQAFSAPSKQTQSSNAKDELSSTASINASSTTLIPSSELLASKPRDSTLKREQNSCYEHDNGLIVDEMIASGLADHTPLKSLLRPLGLPLTRASLPSPLPSIEPAAPGPNAPGIGVGRQSGQTDTSEAGPAIVQVPAAAGQDVGVDYFEVFKEIFSKMVQISNEAGAKFVFVNIPAYQTVCDGIDHPWKKRVLDFARNSGVDFIDLELDFRNADKTIGREELFAVPPCGGHFSERGYKVIGDRLLQYLQLREQLAHSDHPAEIAPDGWRLATTWVRRNGPATAPKVLWSETQVYQSYVKFGAVLAATSDVPTRTEGASILGLPYKRHKYGDRLRINVKFTAYSLQDNEIVAALFVGDGSKSARIATQPVRAGSSASVMLTYDDDLSNAPVNIEVRVGSRLPGELYINGDDTGAVASELKTSLTIEELTTEEFQGRIGALIYVGAALSESELLNARRMLAARMREPSVGVLARTVEDAKRWAIRKTATTRDFHHQQTYQSYARVDRVIDADTVVDVEGASIMGYAGRPSRPSTGCM